MTSTDSDFLNRVYDVLVRFGGADEHMRQSFIQNHQDKKFPCAEWRFCGHLGFGGKYRIRTNKVDCYSEDETKERREIIAKVNAELSKLNADLTGEATPTILTHHSGQKITDQDVKDAMESGFD